MKARGAVRRGVAEAAGKRRRRHGLRDAALAVGGIGVGIALTFVPRLLDDGGEPLAAPVLAGPAESLIATGPTGGPAPALSDPGAESPVAAVEAFLAALRRGDPASSFQLLSAEDRRTIATAEDWVVARADVLAPVLGYDVGEPEADGAGTVVPAVVELEPGLDEFSGLTPARANVRWSVVEDQLGWRVSLAGSTVEPLYPADTGAAAAAQAWLDGGGACDPEGAAGPGVVFLGLRQYLVDRLCQADGPFTVGPVGQVRDPAVTSDLVAAFGSGALGWARTVPVDAGRDRVLLVLAPVGDRWVVIDVAEGDR